VSTAREEVLRRVRDAVGSPAGAVDLPGRAVGGAAGAARPNVAVAGVDVIRDYRHTGDLRAGSPELIDLLVDRLEDYKATVVRCTGDDESVAAAIAGELLRRGVTSVVTPPGIPAGWRGDDLPGRVTDEGQLSADDLDAIDAVLTGSAVSIAQTGTIVLVAGPLCGRRAITLVPDVHVCVVRTTDVVETVPEGLALLDPLLPLTFISGPSATSDIELERVEGVHGPRTLIVVVAG